MDYNIVKIGDDSMMVPSPSSYRDCISLVQSDCYRYTGMQQSVWKIIFVALLKNNYKTFHFWFRLSQYRKGWFCWFARWRYKRISTRYGIEISPDTLIGAGFYIGHFCGIVVNPSAIIGNNVNISQFTTIGSNEGEAAVVGNNVYIGPSVCLVEAVKLGHNATIGAGAVVVKDVPRDATMVGVPAKIINYNNPGRFICNRWVL